PIRSYTTPLPPGAVVGNVALSQQGTRLAWLMDCDGSKQRPDLVKRLERFFGVPAPVHVIQLWTSDVAGRNRHLIGYQAGAYKDDDIPLLQWSPDGKRLLFEYKQSLYTVPTD
ncbi:MAG: hypothetical protein M3Y13_03195, partial [Armatimonadota bacterium]|nr:hypothetical protein [Armatimonadota bacterium]